MWLPGRRRMSHPRRTCGGEATWRTGVSETFVPLDYDPKGMVIKLLGLLWLEYALFLISKDSHCRLVAGKVGSPSGQPCACAGQHWMSCEVTPHSGPRRAAVYPKDMKEKMCLCKNWSIYVCIVFIYIYICTYTVNDSMMIHTPKWPGSCKFWMMRWLQVTGL